MYVVNRFHETFALFPLWRKQLPCDIVTIKNQKNFVRFCSLRGLIGEGGGGVTEFEKIYRTYFDDVYRYIRRLSGDEEIAEEVTSETFFKAMRSIGGFRGDCDVRVWLCQIAKNCYYTYLKKKKNTDSIDDIELSELPADEKTPEEKYIRHDEASRIRTALHNVPEPYREVFMWRVFAELSFKQIGQIFGKSEDWACVTYHRARAMIRTGMEGKTDEK